MLIWALDAKSTHIYKMDPRVKPEDDTPRHWALDAESTLFVIASEARRSLLA